MNLSTFLKSALIATSLIATSVAHASDRKIVIKMNGQQFRGQQTLKLKQLIKAQHPAIKLQRFDIDRVRLVAKSKKGRGHATLSIGGTMSRSKVLGGIPSEFHQEDPYTYDRQVFMNPKNNSGGHWQIALGGNIKVKKVVVFLERKSQGARPGNPGGPIKKSCTVTLETYWGQDLVKLSATASGRTGRVAKAKACDQALAKCHRKIDGAPFLMCSVN